MPGVKRSTFGPKIGKRLRPEIEGVMQIFDFPGVLARTRSGYAPKGVSGAWNAVGKAVQGAIETYDPSVKFAPVHVVGSWTAVEKRRLKSATVAEPRSVKIKMVVTKGTDSTPPT